jgi:hypothetical protein
MSTRRFVERDIAARFGTVGALDLDKDSEAACVLQLIACRRWISDEFSRRRFNIQ